MDWAVDPVINVNNSTIENAHFGIKSYIPLIDTDGDLTLYTHPRGELNISNQTTFKNCWVGIDVSQGTFTPNEPYVPINPSTIDGVNFVCDQLLTDPIYNGTGALAFIVNRGWNANLDITNCTFINSSSALSNQRAIAISSWLADLGQITGNTFEGVSLGAVLTNALNIEGNIFQDCERGLYVEAHPFINWGSAIVNINNNQFFNLGVPSGDDGNSYTVDDTYGVWYVAGAYSQDIAIQNNYFEGAPSGNPYTSSSLNSYGVVVENAYNTNHRFAVFNNEFFGMDVAIQGQGDNNGLQIKCNTFAADNNPHAVAGILVMDQMNDMGDFCADGIPNTEDDKFQAGNEWMDLCLGNNQTDILKDINAASFTYYAHKEGLTGTETTVPDCNSGGFTLLHCNGNANSESTKTSTSCDDAFSGWFIVDGGGNGTISSQINQLIVERDIHIVALNNLQQQLIDPEIQNNLIEEIAQEYEYIDAYNNEIASLFLENNDELGYENFMEGTESALSKMELANHYIEEGDNANAQRVLQEIILLNRPSYLYENINYELQYNLNKEYLATIEDLLIETEENNLLIYQLAANDILTLEEIRDYKVPASVKTEFLLAMNNQTSIPVTTEQGDSYISFYHNVLMPLTMHPIKKAVVNTNSGNNNGFDYQLTILPNPSTTSSTVLFSLPPEGSDAQIILFDQYQNPGEQLQVIEADELTNSATINTSNLSNGIYIVYLQVDGVGVASDQLIVIH